jgi:hypothetical protein
MQRRVSFLAALFLTLAGAACNYNRISGPPSTSVGVSVREYLVIVEHSPLPAGKVTFRVRNRGPKFAHEFVIAKTALRPDKLPTKADGSVNEDASGLQVLSEIEKFPPEETRDKTLTLSPGRYVLFCNLVETQGNETLVHYKLGMRIGLAIT